MIRKNMKNLVADKVLHVNQEFCVFLDKKEKLSDYWT